VLAVNRGHWSIESVHYIIDWNYDEDRSQIRTGFGPENITRLRRFAVGLGAHQNLTACAPIELPTPGAAPWPVSRRWARHYHPRPRWAGGSLSVSIPGSFLASAEGPVPSEVPLQAVARSFRWYGGARGSSSPDPVRLCATFGWVKPFAGELHLFRLG